MAGFPIKQVREDNWQSVCPRWLPIAKSNRAKVECLTSPHGG